jgi:riboflavin-specific deaminase-like protein
MKPLEEVELRRLLPESGLVTVDEAASGLALGEKAPSERPHLALNMVSTADGKATIQGRTRALGGEADRALFHHLRTQVDAVMVGAGTLRVERYGRLVRLPELREKREREGLEPDPLAVVVSGRLLLPADIPLLADPESRVVVLTSSEGEIEGCAAQVEYIRAPESAAGLELAPLLRTLREQRGVRSILCEGGPTLNWTLLREELVDELFLTLTPQLAAGRDVPTIVVGNPLPEPLELELVSLLEGDGELFLRYGIRG